MSAIKEHYHDQIEQASRLFTPDMKKVIFNGELVLTLANKQEWIKKVPNHLPEKPVTSNQ